jgi:hypothetical protein
VDGDGTRDFVIGTPGERFAVEIPFGLVRLFSGIDGHFLREWRGLKAGDEFGYCVRYVPEFSNRMGPLLIVTAPGLRGGPVDAVFGGIFAYSLNDGNRVWQVIADSPGTRFGEQVVVLAARQSGATPLLAVSSPEIEMDRGRRLGQVELRNAADGSLRGRSQAPPGDWVSELTRFGQSMANCADVDGDGIEDLAISTLFAGPLQVLGSRDLNLQHQWGPPQGMVRRLWELIPVGDVDDDGSPDLASLVTDGAIVQEPHEGNLPDLSTLVEVLSVSQGRVIRRVEFEFHSGMELHRLLWNPEAQELAVLDPAVHGASSWSGSVTFVDVRSGRTRAVVFPSGGRAFPARGPELVGDLDGDGVRDLGIVVMEPQFGSGWGVILISWKAAALLGTFDPPHH